MDNQMQTHTKKNRQIDDYKTEGQQNYYKNK